MRALESIWNWLFVIFAVWLVASVVLILVAYA